jgi:undecaprenyl-phosphate 4-deoxy-4-formamido-L-arabinose transferase
MEKISFVIPCYNSENTIKSVVDEIRSVVSENEKYDYEVIAAIDCSPDNVLDVLTDMAIEDKHVKVLDMAINGGQHAAIMAGLYYSTGDYVVLLDDDGQCPTDKLWELMKPLSDGYDVSYAKYPLKKESGFRTWGSSVNDSMCCSMLKKPKGLQLSNFVVFKRFVVDKMLEYKNPYPYIDGLVLRTSAKIANVEMDERERASGKSNYTFKKLLNLFINGFTAFSVKPLRIATYMGGICSVGGFVFMITLIIRKIIYGADIDAGYTSLMAVMLFIGGAIMLLLGVIGEYVGRMYISINSSPQYVVRKTYNIDDKK